jgi:hypothetical protein
MTNVLDKVAAAKEEAEERLSRGGGPRAQFWKPKNGDNTVRVMPPWLNPGHDPDFEVPPAVEFYDGQFWRQVAQHWNVSEDQKGPILCPKQTPGLSGACPICEFVAELRQDKSDTKAQALVKEIRAKTTYLLNVVDVNDSVYTADDAAEWTKTRPDNDCPFKPGDTKVQLYAAPLTVYDAILGLITANKRDITRFDTGRNIIITRHPNQNPIKTRYTVVPEFDPSGFELLGELPALHQQGFLMDYDKMLDLLHSGVGGNFVAALPEGDSAGSLPSGETTTTDTPPASEDTSEQERSVADLTAELTAATAKAEATAGV